MVILGSQAKLVITMGMGVPLITGCGLIGDSSQSIVREDGSHSSSSPHSQDNRVSRSSGSWALAVLGKGSCRSDVLDCPMGKENEWPGSLVCRQERILLLSHVPLHRAFRTAECVTYQRTFWHLNYFA